MKLMTSAKRLFLYEEIALLALRNQKGTVATSFLEHAVAGAVLAELLLDQRITIDSQKKKLVGLRDPKPTGDPIIDECLVKMASAKRRASLQAWVTRLSGIRKLRHKVARQLCNRAILRADEDKVALIFTRKIYPEIDPRPEMEIVTRLRSAIFADEDLHDPRTVTLVALADGAGLLGETFGRKDVKARKKRIAHIVEGDGAGKAVREAIEACRTAAVAAAVAASAT